MNALVFIAVASIIVYRVKAVAPKQLNLALETVLQFDKKDRATDLAVLDKVQDFLDQIKNAMKTSARRSGGDDLTFTGFLVQAAEILKNLDDDTLEEAYVVINDESRRYINTEKDLKELFDNKDMRRYVSEKLDDYRELTADDLRRHLNGIITLVEYNGDKGEASEFLEIGNTLYEGASDKLRRALSDLSKMGTGGEYNIGNILKSTLRSLAYLHYLSLGRDVKTELINMVKHYWRSFTDSLVDNDDSTHKWKKTRNTRRYRTTKKFSWLNLLREKAKKPEIFLSNTDLGKLFGGSHHNDKKSVSKSYNKKKSSRHPSTRGRAFDRHKEKKRPRTKHQESPDFVPKEESEEKVLMGGQKTRDVHFRGQITSQEFVADEDRKKDNTEEIVIHHSNVIDVGLSRKTPGRLNITFVSPDNSRIGDDIKVIRKSNTNDTFGLDTGPVKGTDVDAMIKHIEEQIQAVKDQVAYVKSLTNSKRMDNTDVTILNNKTENVSSTQAFEPPKVYTFRARYDTENNSSEVGSNHNRTIENVTESTFTNVSETTIINEEKEPVEVLSSEDHKVVPSAEDHKVVPSAEDHKVVRSAEDHKVDHTAEDHKVDIIESVTGSTEVNHTQNAKEDTHDNTTPLNEHDDSTTPSDHDKSITPNDHDSTTLEHDSTTNEHDKNDHIDKTEISNNITNIVETGHSPEI
ncbi:uncharacterized protein LOC125239348 [Leguminivora glycinivorella]|uniref:uncharacterized protein LOC125239348 n=1 Tax=Leguminivora glycinivorella TaxID=1035111 RepID=UPI00200E70EA|nr:uncharacterized protein LOC125239348 [Leguminivora glycinivorella]